MVRTAHDQQRPGRPKNPVLGILNIICKVYVTIIRGTPMMVQILIMGLVVFASSRNFTMVDAALDCSTRGPMWRRSSGAA